MRAARSSFGGEDPDPVFVGEASDPERVVGCGAGLGRGTPRRNAQLRKENRELARANDILQAAASFFGAALVVRGRKVFTTRPDKDHVRAPDLVKRDFTAPAPNRLWVMDFTYVPTWAGMVYVAFVTDLYSRMIVGWNLATSMRTDLVMTALQHAVWRRDTLLDELITHSDAGSQLRFKGS